MRENQRRHRSGNKGGSENRGAHILQRVIELDDLKTVNLTVRSIFALIEDTKPGTNSTCEMDAEALVARYLRLDLRKTEADHQQRERGGTCNHAIISTGAADMASRHGETLDLCIPFRTGSIDWQKAPSLTPALLIET